MFWDKFSEKIRKDFDQNPDDYLAKKDTSQRAYVGGIHRIYPVMRNDEDLPKIKDEYLMGQPETRDGYSQGTIRSLMYIREMEKYFDPSKVDYLFDFGPGYGNNARIWHTLFQTKSIVLCDLPILQPLSKYYLEKHDIEATWVSDDEIPSIPRNSLFFASHSLNECSLVIREKIERKLEYFDHIYIVYNDRFNGIDNIEYFEQVKSFLPHKTIDIIHNKHTAKWSLIATGL